MPKYFGFCMLTATILGGTWGLLEPWGVLPLIVGALLLGVLNGMAWNRYADRRLSE